MYIDGAPFDHFSLIRTIIAYSVSNRYLVSIVGSLWTNKRDVKGSSPTLVIFFPFLLTKYSRNSQEIVLLPLSVRLFVYVFVNEI